MSLKLFAISIRWRSFPIKSVTLPYKLRNGSGMNGVAAPSNPWVAP